MSLICDETLACENCNDCRKVKENKYSDIIRFNGKDNSIKKGNIELIQDTFKKSSLEGKAKIYIIENIEYATKEAMNTLLKMLEEPTEGIYAIFTARRNRTICRLGGVCYIHLTIEAYSVFSRRLPKSKTGNPLAGFPALLDLVASPAGIEPATSPSEGLIISI